MESFTNKIINAQPVILWSLPDQNIVVYARCVYLNLIITVFGNSSLIEGSGSAWDRRITSTLSASSSCIPYGVYTWQSLALFLYIKLWLKWNSGNFHLEWVIKLSKAIIYLPSNTCLWWKPSSSLLMLCVRLWELLYSSL